MLKRLFCWVYFRGSLFSKGLVVGRNFAFRNGFGLSIKTAKTTTITALKLLETATDSNSPWAYIREGLLSEGYLRLRIRGLIFERVFFGGGGGEGGLLSEFYGIISHLLKILSAGAPVSFTIKGVMSPYMLLFFLVSPQRSNAARVRNMNTFNGGKLPGNPKHFLKTSKDKAVPGKRSFKRWISLEKFLFVYLWLYRLVLSFVTVFLAKLCYELCPVNVLNWYRF